MQNVNEKVHEEEERLLEECDKDPFYNMSFCYMHSFVLEQVFAMII